MTSITGKDNYLDEVLFYLLIVTKVPDFLLFPDSRKVKYCRAMKRGRLEEQNKILFLLNCVGV